MVKPRAASSSTAAADDAPGGFRAILRRLPLRSQAAPLLGAFVCSVFIYDRIGASSGASAEGRSAGAFAAGIATFVLLFVELRLADDLDDLERDHQGDSPGSAGAVPSKRRRILGAIAATLALIAALNLGRPGALLAAAAAIATIFAAPFVFKRHLPDQMLLGSVAFEGGPLLCFLYPYFWWSGAAPPARAPFASVAAVAGALWVGYEVWKFSRKLHTDAMQPYLLKPTGVRVALSVFFLLAAALNMAVARAAGLSSAFAAFGVALPAALAGWLHLGWPDPRKSEPAGPPAWGGMVYIIALELGMLVDLSLFAPRAGS